MQNEKRSVGVVIVEAILGLLSRLPLRFHLRVGRFVSWFLRSVIHYRRDVVITNLSRSFPELKYKQITALARQFYDHLGDIFAEAIWFGGCKGEKGRKRLRDSHLADVTNPETYNKLYDNGRSMMVLTSHAGNWELLGGWFCYNHDDSHPFDSGYASMRVVYRRLKSAAWDRVIFGFPVWAANVTPPIRTFIKENDLTGKRIAAFACEGGSGAEKAFARLKAALGMDTLEAELVLIDPTSRPDPKNDEKIAEFCARLSAR